LGKITLETSDGLHVLHLHGELSVVVIAFSLLFNVHIDIF